MSEKKELWAVYHLGPCELDASPDFETAVLMSRILNYDIRTYVKEKHGHEEPLIYSIPFIWPHSEEAWQKSINEQGGMDELLKIADKQQERLFRLRGEGDWLDQGKIIYRKFYQEPNHD